jgi:hypothetical protein
MGTGRQGRRHHAGVIRAGRDRAEMHGPNGSANDNTIRKQQIAATRAPESCSRRKVGPEPSWRRRGWSCVALCRLTFNCDSSRWVSRTCATRPVALVAAEGFTRRRGAARLGLACARRDTIRRRGDPPRTASVRPQNSESVTAPARGRYKKSASRPCKPRPPRRAPSPALLGHLLDRHQRCRRHHQRQDRREGEAEDDRGGEADPPLRRGRPDGDAA